MERNANMISWWEVSKMDACTFWKRWDVDFLVYGFYRDWLSMENTGIKSPWHYSKVCTNAHAFARYEIDIESAVYADLVEHWRYTDHNENVYWIWSANDDDFVVVDCFTFVLWFDTLTMERLDVLSDTDETNAISYFWNNKEATTK